ITLSGIVAPGPVRPMPVLPSLPRTRQGRASGSPDPANHSAFSLRPQSATAIAGMLLGGPRQARPTPSLAGRKRLDRLRLGRCWIDHGANFRNPVRWEPPLFCVLADHRLVRRDVHAINLIAGDVAVKPLNLRAEALQHVARLLRNPLKLQRRQLAGA